MSFEPANGVSPTGVIYTGSGFDVAETLPPRAREHLRRLRQISRDAHRVLPQFPDIQDLSTQKQLAEARLRQFDDGFNLRKEDQRVIDQDALVAKLTEELQRLQTLDATRSEVWRIASQLTASVESFLRSGRPPGTVLEDHDGDVPKLIKNETIIDGIERLRRRGRELRADLSRVRSAPYPSSYVRAKIKAEVLALAQAGAPIVSDVIEHDRSAIWPRQGLRADVFNSQMPSFASGEVVDALGLLAFMFKDQLIARLDALVTEEADDPASLSHEAREKAEAEAMGLARHRKAGSCVDVAGDGSAAPGRTSQRHQPGRLARRANYFGSARWRDRNDGRPCIRHRSRQCAAAALKEFRSLQSQRLPTPALQRGARMVRQCPASRPPLPEPATLRTCAVRGWRGQGSQPRWRRA
jgi:hypothetical protein